MAATPTNNLSRRTALAALAGTPVAMMAVPALAEISADRSEWERAIAEYRHVTAVLSTHASGRILPSHPDYERLTAEEGELITRQVAAERHLFSLPAPDVAAMVEKAEIYESAAMFDGVDIGGEHFAGLVRDVRRLAREG